MTTHVILLSLPGLRSADLKLLPRLEALAVDRMVVVPSFPAVSRVVQANMVTGCLPSEHGIVADSFYLRQAGEIVLDAGQEAWCGAEAIWDVLRAGRPGTTSAACWTTYAASCGADWAVAAGSGAAKAALQSHPGPLADELIAELGTPPAEVAASAPDRAALRWMAEAVVAVARRGRPNFLHTSLPHIDAAAQRHGPDSTEAQASLEELNDALAVLIDGLQRTFGGEELLWLVATEYVVTPVDSEEYPNRLLHDAGLLATTSAGWDLTASRAWALAEHQAAHVYVRDGDPAVLKDVEQLFAAQQGIAEVLCGEDRARYDIDHARCGDAVLISAPTSWQARDLSASDAVRGSHGAPALDESQRGVILCSEPGVLVGNAIADTDVAGLILRQFAL